MHIRDYILVEAQNYRDMFKDFVAVDQTAKTLVDKYITWARTSLKKNDRIVWFLRWVRVELAGRLKHTDSDTELAKIAKRLAISLDRSDLVPIANLMTNLTHFLGLPIPAIQQIVWLKQTPQELLETFRLLETEWKENTEDESRLHRYEVGDEPKVVLQFPDGYAWFNLETHSCSAEARSMGHCGNSGGNRRDTILSLRRLTKTVSGRSYWYPMLTFILDRNGVLGEMKGRGNDKPIEKYHPYIVALLRSDLIQGIKGGGYLPHHNFSLNDLDDDVREELLAAKPDLGSVADLYAKEGMSERVLGRLDHGLQANNLSTEELRYEAEQKRFIVNTWASFGDFLRDMDDDEVETILEIALGEADFQDQGEIDVAFNATIRELPETWQDKLIARAGISARNVSRDHACDLAAQQLMAKNDDWFEMFREIFEGGLRISHEAWDVIRQYVAAGWPYVCNAVYDNLDENIQDDVEADKPVILYIGESDLVNYASPTDGEDDDYGDVGYQIRQMEGAWETIESQTTFTNVAVKKGSWIRKARING